MRDVLVFEIAVAGGTLLVRSMENLTLQNGRSKALLQSSLLSSHRLADWHQTLRCVENNALIVEELRSMSVAVLTNNLEAQNISL